LEIFTDSQFKNIFMLKQLSDGPEGDPGGTSGTTPFTK